MRSTVERLCAAATAAALVPLWLFRYFPTQDGPSHLYNAFVLGHYGSRYYTTVRSYFALNLRPFPNWTTYLLMAPLTRIFPPLVVQQIVLSLCVISVPAAVLYLQKSFKPAADASALLGVLLAYGYLFFMGFFNFVLGAALFTFAVGWWWRHRDGRYLIPLYALFLVIYCSHGLAFASTLMAIAVLAAATRRWRVLLEIAPAALLMALEVAARASGQASYRSFPWHLRQLVTFFAAGHVAVSAMVLLLVVIAIIAAIARRSANALALVSAVLFAGYWIAPWGSVAGGWIQAGWLNERLLFLTLLTLPAWIAVPRPAMGIALMLIAIAAHLGLMSVQAARINGRIRDIAAAGSLIRPHSTVRTLFPPTAVSPQVTPTLHLTAYLALRPDVVDLDDYEALLPDFPLRYRSNPPSLPPDYVVVWRGAQVRNVIGYRVVFANDDIRLLERAKPTLQ